MQKRVLVLGGGVAGLSAAHELVERGFDVEVHEAKAVPGGKARTIYVTGSGTDGRPDLPGEHGFRFFPSFYRHLPDTMKRIPFAGRKRGVYDNLVQASHYLLADGPKKSVRFLLRFPRSLGQWRELLAGIYEGRQLGIPDGELAFFVERLLVILTSCQQRRLAEYEQIDWWRFIAADGKSPAYQTYLAVGLTRSLVALKAQEASTRTVGDILVQLLLGIYSPWTEFDRVLDGPTSEAWIDPWLAYLRGRGVRYVERSEVVGIDCGADGRIHGATVADPAGARRTVRADHYVLALPVEAVVPLVDARLAAFEPRLARLHELRVAWMNGLQLYLRQDRRVVGGHANYVATPSALTSISQEQFFRRKLTDYGDGTVRGCLSIDISDWESPGMLPPHRPLKDLPTRQEVMREVRAQLQAALGPADAAALDDANLAAWFLDPDIELPNPSGAVNLEPLLINTRGSWANRPEAATRIPNLFLAADYVRTYTDSGDDGGGQRSGASRRQRHPRRRALAGGAVPLVAAVGAGDLRPRARARLRPVEARAAARRARPRAHRGASRCARHPAPRAHPPRRRRGRRGAAGGLPVDAEAVARERAGGGALLDADADLDVGRHRALDDAAEGLGVPLDRLDLAAPLQRRRTGERGLVVVALDADVVGARQKRQDRRRAIAHERRHGAPEQRALEDGKEGARGGAQRLAERGRRVQEARRQVVELVEVAVRIGAEGGGLGGDAGAGHQPRHRARAVRLGDDARQALEEDAAHLDRRREQEQIARDRLLFGANRRHAARELVRLRDGDLGFAPGRHGCVCGPLGQSGHRRHLRR